MGVGFMWCGPTGTRPPHEGLMHAVVYQTAETGDAFNGTHFSLTVSEIVNGSAFSVGESAGVCFTV